MIIPNNAASDLSATPPKTRLAVTSPSVRSCAATKATNSLLPTLMIELRIRPQRTTRCCTARGPPTVAQHHGLEEACRMNRPIRGLRRPLLAALLIVFTTAQAGHAAELRVLTEEY